MFRPADYTAPKSAEMRAKLSDSLRAAGRVPPTAGANRHDWTPAEDAALGTATDVVLAARFGLSETTVRDRRNRLGIPAFGRT